jgi:hypothetical protein
MTSPNRMIDDNDPASNGDSEEAAEPGVPPDRVPLPVNSLFGSNSGSVG